jgi:hypothetical protein
MLATVEKPFAERKKEVTVRGEGGWFCKGTTSITPPPLVAPHTETLFTCPHTTALLVAVFCIIVGFKHDGERIATREKEL